MAGQKWFGQLEGRIQQTLQELAATKKVIWYIPDILQIALTGTHKGQAACILDQILPAISAGRLVIWTEATPASTARLLRLRPALRSVLEAVRLEPLYRRRRPRSPLEMKKGHLSSLNNCNQPLTTVKVVGLRNA